MRRLAVAPALAALAFLAPSVSAAPPAPQVVDPANDANGINGQGQPILGSVPNNTATPGVSQAYADVLNVRWSTVKKVTKVKKKTVTTVTGFTVTVNLSAAPKPPEGTIVVYRILGTTALCPYFGVVWYSAKNGDGSSPQSAVRDNCNGATSARLTPIAAPVIKDKTMTWTVPLSVIPKDTKVGVGTLLTGLYFTVVEIEDFKGQKVPSQVPTYGGATGLGVGVLDDAKPGDAVYKIGS